ncbi:MAG TPA: Na+/H+ antiporter subunit D [Vicinamibacterales bacterium]|nr:Na+/H+ antiporter subunit D [Vicinamibacterales bacterium]
MTTLLVLPVVIPLLTAILLLLAWRQRRVQRILSALSAGAVLVCGLLIVRTVTRDGVVAVQLGDWPAPFGVTFVADMFSALMIAVTGLIGVTVAVYSAMTIDANRERYGYHPLVQMLLTGVCGAFLTGDLFNLYVWFEVMLMASFVLLALGGGRAQIEGAVKYVALNLIASALFLAAAGVLYGLSGTLNMADLSERLAASDRPGLVTAASMLLLVAFGIKAAAFPFFFWLPASYHTPPAAVSALFAGLLTKVGVYALIRVFTLIFVADVAYTHGLVLVIAALTMITGVLGAWTQREFRRVLSFHIVSQIGYMLMGLGLFTRLALAGSVFYILHHIVVKTNLFLVAGAVQRLQGSGELARLGGLYASRPFLAALFLVPALSLAGIPPLSGFFAKLSLIQAGLETEAYLMVAIALAVGLLTLLSMTKIWHEAFWKAAPEGADEPRRNIRGLLLPIGTLAAVTIVIGLAAGHLFALATVAADQLMDRETYVSTVLGGRR